MNCKQGEVAVIKKSMIPKFIGLFVTILEPSPERNYGPEWVCKCSRHEHVIPDAWLRPIRDSDGQDETLTWKIKETV